MLAGALALITSPITLTVAGVAALVLGLRYLTGSWEGVLKVLSFGLLDFKTLGAIWETLKKAAGDLVGALSYLAQTLGNQLGKFITGTVIPAWTSLRESFTAIVSAIGSLLAPAFKLLGAAITAVWDSAIVGLIREAGRLAAMLAGWAIIKAGEAAFQALSIAIGYVVGRVKAIAEAFTKGGKAIKGDMGPVLNWIRDTFAGLIANQIAGIQKVWGWVNKVAQATKDALEDLALLAGYVPKGPAVGAPKAFAAAEAIGAIKVPIVPAMAPDVKAMLDAQMKELAERKPVQPKLGGGDEAAKETKKLLEEAAKAQAEYQDKLTDAALSGTALRLTQIARERQAELDKYKALGAAAQGTRDAVNAYYDHQVELATGASTVMAELAREAGFVSRAELQETATTARALYESMRASGEYGYAALAEAAEKAGEAERRALGINVEAFKVTNGLSKELWDSLTETEKKYQDIAKAGQQFQNKLTDATLSGTQRRLVEIERERQAELDKYTGIDEVSKATRAKIDAYYDHQVDLANETAGTIVERMRAAGVATQADLDATAAHFKRAYEQMVASGEFAYDALEAARQRWKDAEIAAANTWGESWIGAFGQIASAFDNLAKNTTGRASEMFGAVGSLVGSLQTAAQVAKDTGSNWGQASKMFDASAKGVDRVAAGAAAVGSVVEGIQGIAAATDKASAGARALGGAMAGAKAGAAFGPYGMAIGAAAGLVVGLVRGKPEWAKAADEVGRDFGVKISEGLARAIKDQAKELYKGDRSTAIAANIGKIFKESGEQSLGHQEPGQVDRQGPRPVLVPRARATREGQGRRAD